MHVPQFASFSRRRLAVVAGSLAASLASACSGGSGTSTGISVPPNTAVSPAATVSPSPAAASSPLTITQSADGYAPSAGPKTAFVLYAGQFFDYTHPYAYAIATQGSSGAAVPVTWSLSGPAVSPSSPPNANFQTAPPNGIELTGSSFGKSTLTATTPSQTASVPVYYFPSVFYGCTFRASGAASFDPDPQPSRDPLAEDAYVTAPVDPNDGLNPCTKSAYATAQGTPIVFHFPYGATIVTDGDDPAQPVAAGATRGPAFQDVQATAYRDDFTSISSTALEASLNPCGNTATAACTTINGSILLFKTMAGRVVKLSVTEIDGNDALLGPYEASTDPGGPFPY